jgi:hypothetical protein
MCLDAGDIGQWTSVRHVKSGFNVSWLAAGEIWPVDLSPPEKAPLIQNGAAVGNL